MFSSSWIWAMGAIGGASAAPFAVTKEEISAQLDYMCHEVALEKAAGNTMTDAHCGANAANSADSCLSKTGCAQAVAGEPRKCTFTAASGSSPPKCTGGADFLKLITVDTTVGSAAAALTKFFEAEGETKYQCNPNLTARSDQQKCDTPAVAIAGSPPALNVNVDGASIVWPVSNKDAAALCYPSAGADGVYTKAELCSDLLGSDLFVPKGTRLHHIVNPCKWNATCKANVVLGTTSGCEYPTFATEKCAAAPGPAGAAGPAGATGKDGKAASSSSRSVSVVLAGVSMVAAIMV